MALATRIGVGAVAVAACGGFLLGAPLDLAGAHGDAGRPPALIQLAGCARQSARSLAPIEAGNGLRQDISVTIPPTALIRVDAEGIVRAVATNTGCAPREDDDFFVIQPDGAIQAAPADDFAGRPWIGDFTTPGEYVEQAG